MPAISLGLWNNFGTDRPLETQRAIVRRAFDLGITHFDLANNYGPPTGSAELNFGRILSQDLRPYCDELVISTKAGYEMWSGPYGDFGSRKYLLSSLDAGLARLKLDYVDVFYSHERDQSLAQLALSWVLRHPQITSAVIGASSVVQLENNVAALDAETLSPSELAEIEKYAVHGTGLN